MIICEIADKMETIEGMWMSAIVISAVLSSIAVSNKHLRYVILSLLIPITAVLLYGSYHETFLEDDFSRAIWLELGKKWVNTSFVSRSVPLFCVSMALIAKYAVVLPRIRKREETGSEVERIDANA